MFVIGTAVVFEYKHLVPYLFSIGTLGHNNVGQFHVQVKFTTF